MIIGLTGYNGAGKGEVARILRERSFYYTSLSDVLRDDITRRKHTITRKQLIATGNALRNAEGPGVLAKRILAKLENDRHYVVDSIRHPAEIAELRGRSDFILISVEATPAVRFQRIKARGREADPKTLRAFQDTEKTELNNPATTVSVPQAGGQASTKQRHTGQPGKTHAGAVARLAEGNPETQSTPGLG